MIDKPDVPSGALREQPAGDRRYIPREGEAFLRRSKKHRVGLNGVPGMCVKIHAFEAQADRSAVRAKEDVNRAREGRVDIRDENRPLVEFEKLGSADKAGKGIIGARIRPCIDLS